MSVIGDLTATFEKSSKKKNVVVDLWERDLAAAPNGKGYAKTLRNVALVLTHSRDFRGVIAFDDFANRLVATRESPAGPQGQWTDDHDLRATVWIQGSKWRLEASDDLVARAVHAVATKQRVHPLRDRLQALKWDGKSRVDTWLSAFLGAEDTAVHRAIGSTWLLGAVARAFEPGCKVDAALILEGEQGRGKSTALKVLSLGFFSDDLADIGGKDAAMQLQGAWIHELAELDAISRAEASRVKSFITRSVDRFRPPWGRHVVELARQCVFAGSTNHNDYLRDATGARRFLPVRVGRINLDALRQEVEQLWAEALQRYRNGERTYIADESLNALLRDHTSERYQGDPWHERIESFAQVRESISVAECLGHVGVEMGRWTQADQNRIAKLLMSLGYMRKRVAVDGKRQWRYYPVNSATGADTGDQTLPNESHTMSQCPSIYIYNNNIEEPHRPQGKIEVPQDTGATGATGTPEIDADDLKSWWDGKNRGEA